MSNTTRRPHYYACSRYYDAAMRQPLKDAGDGDTPKMIPYAPPPMMPLYSAACRQYDTRVYHSITCFCRRLNIIIIMPRLFFIIFINIIFRHAWLLLLLLLIRHTIIIHQQTTLLPFIIILHAIITRSHMIRPPSRRRADAFRRYADDATPPPATLRRAADAYAERGAHYPDMMSGRIRHWALTFITPTLAPWRSQRPRHDVTPPCWDPWGAHAAFTSDARDAPKMHYASHMAIDIYTPHAWPAAWCRQKYAPDAAPPLLVPAQCSRIPSWFSPTRCHYESSYLRDNAPICRENMRQRHWYLKKAGWAPPRSAMRHYAAEREMTPYALMAKKAEKKVTSHALLLRRHWFLLPHYQPPTVTTTPRPPPHHHFHHLIHILWTTPIYDWHHTLPPKTRNIWHHEPEEYHIAEYDTTPNGYHIIYAANNPRTQPYTPPRLRHYAVAAFDFTWLDAAIIFQ